MSEQEYQVIYYPDENSELMFLKAPLCRMFEIMDRYLGYYDRPGHADRLFASNERATLSLFAGGVWRENPKENLVLEEYRDRKWHESGKELKGRTDIWFRVAGRSCAGRSCFAEAKQNYWPPLGKFGSKKAKKIIQLLTKETQNAYANSKPYRDRDPLVHSLGIVFVAPYLYQKDIPKAFRFLNTFKDCLHDNLKAFTETEDYVVLRGSYFREDLLTEQAIYPTHWGQATLPGVEVLFCEQRKKKVNSGER